MLVSRELELCDDSVVCVLPLIGQSLSYRIIVERKRRFLNIVIQELLLAGSALGKVQTTVHRAFIGLLVLVRVRPSCCVLVLNDCTL